MRFKNEFHKCCGQSLMTEGSSVNPMERHRPNLPALCSSPSGLGWTPHLSWLAFCLLENERLLVLHGVCSGSRMRLFVWYVKSLVVILKGVNVSVYLGVSLESERERRPSCNQTSVFSLLISNGSLTTTSLSFTMCGWRPRTVLFFWAVSPEGWGQRMFNN